MQNAVQEYPETNFQRQRADSEDSMIFQVQVHEGRPTKIALMALIVLPMRV